MCIITITTTIIKHAQLTRVCFCLFRIDLIISDYFELVEFLWLLEIKSILMRGTQFDFEPFFLNIELNKKNEINIDERYKT